MSTGISIHIGLNGVDASAYNGWAGTLSGCVNDANSMKAIADSLGYSSTLLLDSDATSSTVIQQIGSAARQLVAGDILLLTYSGHGGIIDDATGGDPGDDGKDETWVLYDRMVLDDELEQMWTQFSPGVRVVVLSDSCHSGTVTRDIPPDAIPAAGAGKVKPAGIAPSSKKEMLYSKIVQSGALDSHYKGAGSKPVVFRTIPTDVQAAVYQKNKDVYSTRQYGALSKNAGTGATVLLISGCQDNQLSSDGDGNGLFTGTLLQVWSNGSFMGTYHDFHSQIVSQMPPTQTPNYFMTGPDNAAFESQNPFTVQNPSSTDTSSVTDDSDKGMASPSVKGPASVSRTGPTPSFQVSAGNKYYVFEITNDASLFDTQQNSGKRTQRNFYGSWSDDGNKHIPGTQQTYVLPASVWSNLKDADTLYFRIVSTSSQSNWDNYKYSTYDNEVQNAPHLSITGQRGSKDVPSAAYAATQSC